ncbi:hypothetical protein HPB49_021196 [Dermacentor silvarum]|uniref:Uncharacterized protein n=1 Tax=Dermacentor silvarum TaxID=543639 RepID=A0ACB8CMG6_DERSI|nr:hypothetical protein HPB49_021196 [Dermacentor silvarum]
MASEQAPSRPSFLPHPLAADLSSFGANDTDSTRLPLIVAGPQSGADPWPRRVTPAAAADLAAGYPGLLFLRKPGSPVTSVVAAAPKLQPRLARSWRLQLVDLECCWLNHGAALPGLPGLLTLPPDRGSFQCAELWWPRQTPGSVSREATSSPFWTVVAPSPCPGPEEDDDTLLDFAPLA